MTDVSQGWAEGLPCRILWQEPLAQHTYYRIGGPAEALAFPKNRHQLRELLLAAQHAGKKVRWFSQGSNLLAPDEGVSGVVIRLSQLDLGIDYDAASSCVVTGASVAISTLLRKCASEGWAGLEFLTGIPGSVGGAVLMNAGTHLGESSSVLEWVEVMQPDGTEKRYPKDSLRFRYRSQEFMGPDEVVLQSAWRVRTDQPEAVKGRMDELLIRRKATQPIQYPSCGSVFKNPKESGLQAWQVIDRLGLRGATEGQAQISEQHSNWIINRGGAKASEVRALIERVQTRAKNELGIQMEPEVKIWLHST